MEGQCLLRCLGFKFSPSHAASVATTSRISLSFTAFDLLPFYRRKIGPGIKSALPHPGIYRDGLPENAFASSSATQAAVS